MESHLVLLKKQKDLISRIERKVINYKKSPKERLTITNIEQALDLAKEWYYNFDDNHSKLLGMEEEKDDIIKVYFENNTFDEFEEVYSKFVVMLKEDLSKIKKTSLPIVAETSTNEAEVRLPQINLPKFSGSYNEWQQFHDMFVSLIHNNRSLSAVQKLHYLKGCLQGEAEQLMKNLSTTDDNYEEGWKILTKRFTNKKQNSIKVMQTLFEQKNIFTESSHGIKNLLDTTSACLKSLQNLQINTADWDVVVNYIVTNKLDGESRKLWEMETSGTDDIPTWKQMSEFLEKRFRTLENLEGRSYSNSSNRVTQHFNKKSFQNNLEVSERNNNYRKEFRGKSCIICSGPHKIIYCKRFEMMSPEERSKIALQRGLCFNCLHDNHSVKDCRLPGQCGKCGRKHHQSLHFESAGGSNENSFESRREQTRGQWPTRKAVAHLSSEKKESSVLLATAVVRVKSLDKISLMIRVLIDQGSEVSFVTESVVQALRLQKSFINGTISGVGEGEVKTKSMVTIQLESLHSPFSVNIKAFVLKSLTSFLPSQRTAVVRWPDLNNLTLADPNYNLPGKIDMILGADVFGNIILEGLVKHPSMTGLIAQNSHLGWILSGTVERNEIMRERHVSLHMTVKEDELLQRFWEIEREPDSIDKKMTEEEIRCERIFQETTKRDGDGRYIVRLPFKNANPECLYGRSREIAMKRFNNLEKRLFKDMSLYEEYKKVIDDYVDQGHMKEITDEREINDPYVVYLPHHAVVKNERETTKVRVVFDASCKGINNVSLNDNLLVGPRLQQELRHILMRWRTHKICIVGDLVKMYRQIKVGETDCDFQRILWRNDPNEEIRHYKLTRLTFGTSCAPYLAVKSLQQLAKEEIIRYPKAASITLKDYYMDDLLTGCNTVHEAITIYEEMSKLMKTGGFEVQKWCTNSTELLKYIKEENQQSNLTVTFKAGDSMKILGVTWNKICDQFEYQFNLPDIEERVTKRHVLSEIARLYDPMGWIAPKIVMAKILMQKLWKVKLSWDDKLTTPLLQEWQRFKNDLVNLKEVSIPRWINTSNKDNIELHVFADASRVAYAAVVYIKFMNSDNEISTSLITSKTRVAPIDKQISIPRLELCAALLAAKLVYEVSQVMEIPKEKIFAWSDSTIVLAWIAGEPSRWTTFVSNRVSEILNLTDRAQWRHVETKHNPADIGSRGLHIKELINCKLWWIGPKWLRKGDDKVDIAEITSNEYETTEEMRIGKTLTSTMKETEEFIWLRFSSLKKMLRVLAYCRRFLKVRSSIKKNMEGTIAVEEIHEVFNICIRETQQFFFKEEITKLRLGHYMTKKSALYTLHPMLDEDGILRVGGRINEANVAYDKRHPIILPSKSHLTTLIIDDAHLKTLHGGPQVMLNLLRSKFWIIRAREAVKRNYRKCVKCLRYSELNKNQLMGNLPEARLSPGRAFCVSGVDYAGPIHIKCSPGRGSKTYKGYICIFVCLFSKAIHIEVVSDLTSQGFIAAFRRFVSRRGHCQALYSDNGTNFIGADKELRNMFNNLKSQLPDELRDLLANDGTSWKFIPPQAPNFGGLWEAGVKSVKKHLRRVVGDNKLTFEELTTVLTQIEAVLNSRPLSYLSDNPNDPMPLTPGHFLVGEPVVVIPDELYKDRIVSHLKRWKYCQKLMNDFWRKWSDEYLVTMNQRYKWTKTNCEPEIDDIVIVKEQNLPPGKWLLGKIIAKHVGKDNLTRVVTVKTKNGLFKRTYNKLVFLPRTE